MDRFVRRENIKHYRQLLKTAKDDAERQQLLKLIAEEQQKQKDAGDKIEE
jgi:rubrerythrin